MECKQDIHDQSLACGHYDIFDCPHAHKKITECIFDCLTRKTGNCRKLVIKELPCGHTAGLIECGINNYRCRVEVLKDEVCGHKQFLPCYRAKSPQVCETKCGKKLQCGHVCSRTCHLLDDPDHLEYVCSEQCLKISPGCSMEHKCPLVCCDPCPPCNLQYVEKKLPICGHSVMVSCVLSCLYYLR